MTRTSKSRRLWGLIGTLWLVPPAEAAQTQAGRFGYDCVLLNGATLVAMQDISQLFPRSLRRCSRARVFAVSRVPEGKAPRVLRDPLFRSDLTTAADPADSLQGSPEAPTLEMLPDVALGKPMARATSGAFDHLILEASRRNGLDPVLVKAMIVVESAHQPHARSPKGALGLMQVMPATGARYGVLLPLQLLDPARNIDVGTRYLRDLHELFKGNIELMLAAYNAGEGAVARYGNRIPPYAETREYVRRVLRIYRGGQR